MGGKQYHVGPEEKTNYAQQIKDYKSLERRDSICHGP